MPTAKGKPQAGDIIEHKDGTRLQVVQRDPGGDFYSIVVRYCDGRARPASIPQAFGFQPECFRILDFSWRMSRGEYKFVTE
jgi:hypothetical protein